MRGGLRHDLCEGLAGPLPVSTLNSEEASEGKSSREAKDKVLGLGAEDRAHEWVCESPTSSKLDSTLGGEFLKLVAIKLLHLDDFPFTEVIIIDVGEPVPVLAGAERAVVLMGGSATQEPGAVKGALHRHDHGATLFVFLLVVHFTKLVLL